MLQLIPLINSWASGSPLGTGAPNTAAAFYSVPQSSLGCPIPGVPGSSENSALSNAGPK